MKPREEAAEETQERERERERTQARRTGSHSCSIEIPTACRYATSCRRGPHRDRETRHEGTRRKSKRAREKSLGSKR